MISGAFLADAANVTADGKLNVLGGVYEWMPIDAPAPGTVVDVTLTVVVLFQAVSGQPPKASLRISVAATGGPPGNSIPADVELPPGAEQGFAVVGTTFTAGSLGRYIVIIETDSGSSFSIPLDLRPRV